ncbi:MAG: NigD-like C-terminal domain-containing protein [Rikenellaceae bacterium]
MKKIIYLSTILSTLLFTSCDFLDGDEGSYADSAAYASTHIVESLSDEDTEMYYFTTDAGQKMLLIDDAMSSSYTFTEDERIVMYYRVIEDYTTEAGKLLEGAAYDCNYGVRLFGVEEVLMGKSATVSTEEQSDAIANNKLTYIYNNVGYSNNYINLCAALTTSDIDNVEIYLVENLMVDPNEYENGYAFFELRYNSGKSTTSDRTYERYISLSTADFEQKIDGMNGIILRATTMNNDEIDIKIEFNL